MAALTRPLSFFDSTPRPDQRDEKKRGHYRPYSTLYADPPFVGTIESKSSSARLVKRSSSLGGLHMLHFKDRDKTRGKAKEKEKEKGKEKREHSKLAVPITVVSPAPTIVTNARPATASAASRRLSSLQPSGVLMPELSSGMRPTTSTSSASAFPALHRVAKKTSMASLLTSSSTTVDDPAGANTPAPSSTLDTTSTSATSSSALIAQKRRSLEYQQVTTKHHDHNASGLFVPKNIWAKRHNPRMKLHPYQGKVPYMQAYDPILLERCAYIHLFRVLIRLTILATS